MGTAGLGESQRERWRAGEMPGICTWQGCPPPSPLLFCQLPGKSLGLPGPGSPPADQEPAAAGSLKLPVPPPSGSQQAGNTRLQQRARRRAIAHARCPTCSTAIWLACGSTESGGTRSAGRAAPAARARVPVRMRGVSPAVPLPFQRWQQWARGG